MGDFRVYVTEPRNGEEPREYVIGIWNGEEVRFNRNFRGHRFTDSEVGELLKGNEIKIMGLVSKDGFEYGAVGRLDWQTFEDEEGETVRFVGFRQTGFVDGVPVRWCGHEFTPEERKLLKEGNELKLSGLISKQGGRFSAVLSYGADEQGKTRILMRSVHSDYAPVEEKPKGPLHTDYASVEEKSENPQYQDYASVEEKSENSTHLDYAPITVKPARPVYAAAEENGEPSAGDDVTDFFKSDDDFELPFGSDDK